MMTLQHKFVEFIPGKIDEGVIYISVEYCTAIHKCPCGCGNKVVTPLSPTDWELIFNGKSVTLYPSIGNWNFECQSHYWIRNNMIEFADHWTDREIRLGRENDFKRKTEYFGESIEVKRQTPKNEKNITSRIWKRVFRFFGL